MKLSRALRIEPGMIVALVGSGGKTTTLFRLAEEIAPSGPVVLTTTTHLALLEAQRVETRVVAAGDDWPSDMARRLRQGNPLLLTGPIDPQEGKAGAVSEQQWAVLIARLKGSAAVVLVEADGARGRPFKAPLACEPVIPAGTSLVVLLMGMEGMGQPLGEATVHRPARFSELAGGEGGAILTPDIVAQALRHPEGYLSKVPSAARLVVFLNQAETPAGQEAAEDLARRVLACPAVGEVLVGSARLPDPVQRVQGRTAGVVLAAGGSRRMGEPKLLKEFRGRPLVSHVVDLALRTMDEVVVVLGANSPGIRAALAGWDVHCVENPNWEQGQSTSLHAAVESLSDRCTSAVFFLGDQPLIPEQLVRKLVARHEETLSPVVAPRTAGRQANPVLFDREAWPALLDLRGDVGGRGLLARHPTQWVEWGDPTVFLDIDGTDDYRRLLELE